MSRRAKQDKMTPGPMDMAPMPFNGMQTSAPSATSFNPMSLNPMIPNSTVAEQPNKTHSVTHASGKRPNIHKHNKNKGK